MIQKKSDPISVDFTYNHHLKSVTPHKIIWNERTHSIIKIGLHHTCYRGRTLLHIFSVSSATLFFRLCLNTDDLSWTLEEISDGLPN